MLFEMKNKVTCPSMQATTFSEAKNYLVKTWMNDDNFETCSTTTYGSMVQWFISVIVL